MATCFMATASFCHRILFSFSEFQYSMLMEMRSIKKTQDQILNFLQHLQQSDANDDGEQDDDEPPKPLQNMEEFDAAETALKSLSRKRRAKVCIDLISLKILLKYWPFS